MDNDLERRDWDVVRGFKQGICKNLKDTLDQLYYEQVKEQTFRYNRYLFRDYITHLEARCGIIDIESIESLEQSWNRPWGSEAEEHTTRLSLHLNTEQEALGRDDIVIPDADKLHHYSMQMYASFF